MKSNINEFFVCSNSERISQGDLLKGFPFQDFFSGEFSEEFIFPYFVVLTQDCDLEQDFNSRLNSKKQDKFLNSILICPAFPAENLREGTHLKNLGYQMEIYNSKRWRSILQNKNSRYHYIPANSKYQTPDLIIDFKKYYTFPREFIYSFFKENYLITINELFRESLSQRFSYYLSRVALPILTND